MGDPAEDGREGAAGDARESGGPPDRGPVSPSGEHLTLFERAPMLVVGR